MEPLSIVSGRRSSEDHPPFDSLSLVDLILSPSARGYFHKAIAQSGSALSPWAYQYNPREVAYQLARDLGLPDTMSTAELVAALRIIPAMAIVEATPGSMDYVRKPPMDQLPLDT